MNSNEFYECSVCGEHFYEIKSFLAHHEQHSDTHRKKNLCMQNSCLKQFQNSKEFKKHVKRSHEIKGSFISCIVTRHLSLISL